MKTGFLLAFGVWAAALWVAPAPAAGSVPFCAEEAAWARLRREAEALDHTLDACLPLARYASNRRTDRRRVAAQRRIQHIGAQVILREERPERVAAEIAAVRRELRRLAARDCRRRAAAARLWGKSRVQTPFGRLFHR